MPRTLIHSRMRQSLSNHFARLCTIEALDGTFDAEGQPSGVWTTFLTNIPCALGTRSSATQTRTETQEWSRRTPTIVLKGRYETILPKYRAVVDGKAYTIMSIEMDDQRLMTVLSVESIDEASG